ncbi:MAG: DUF1553 domain-containing protein [Bryobacter sp.]|nr:DUF1553 domain-containing protein [Bryobacter sp.]
MLLLGGALCPAAPPSYQRQIAPLISAKCGACHNERAAMGGLALLTYDGLAKATGLLEAVSGAKPRMPKAGKPLTSDELTLLRLWVDAGKPKDGEAGQELWWSQRPLQKVQPPAPGHPIDAFIRAKLQENSLSPSPRADARTLARRLTYNLHGLPPDSRQLSLSYAALLDELLASPRYGERWARHWLDVVHYGDSHGYDKDKPRPHAWRYRDWVINAYNSDKPYAAFVEEQLAGDVLYPDDAQAIVATGLLAAGPWDFVGHQELSEGTSDKDLTRVLDRDDMVTAVMSTFNSQTVHCARCHDHKFDPIAQEDYYSLQAVFAGIDRVNRPIDPNPSVARQRNQLWEEKRQLYLQLRPLEEKAEKASSPELDRLEIRIKDASLLLAHLGTPKTPAEEAEKRKLSERRTADTATRKRLLEEYLGENALAEMARLRQQVQLIDEKLKALPSPHYVYAVNQVFDRQGNFRPPLEPRPISLLARGSVTDPQQLVGPGTIGKRFTAANEGGRRLALARWLTHPDNAYTWRSIVNRVWQYHFGAGLVESTNDFGRMGSQPSHPELLDWLAVWFRDEAKGSLKALHRLILSSETYQQSSAENENFEKFDGANRYLWRANRIRLDAESIRDSFVWLTGKMDFHLGGPAVQHFAFEDDHSPIYDYKRYNLSDPGAYRRSIYRFIVRSIPDPFMDRLDCPDASILTPKRNTTLTAVQALTLLNNPFTLRMAEEIAARLSPKQPIVDLYVLALGRMPAAQEESLLEKHAETYGLPSAVRVLLNSNEFAFVD